MATKSPNGPPQPIDPRPNSDEIDEMCEFLGLGRFQGQSEARLLSRDGMRFKERLRRLLWSFIWTHFSRPWASHQPGCRGSDPEGPSN